MNGGIRGVCDCFHAAGRDEAEARMYGGEGEGEMQERDIRQRDGPSKKVLFRRAERLAVLEVEVGEMGTGRDRGE